jgi:hypothetical protein
MHNLVYLCDWLPPDFGAVGQYSLLFARQRAEAGENVVLGGLSSSGNSIEACRVGAGRLTVVRLHAQQYERSDLFRRAAWTLKANVRLLWQLRDYLLRADEIIFTGSPPFMIHLLAPLNMALRKRLTYRITDFHPECLMAALNDPPVGLKLFRDFTVFWRRTVDGFEVLGEDQRQRLHEIGISDDRIALKRDPSPVDITADIQPLAQPPELDGYTILLYSGNFGVAHEYETFVEGYRLHHRNGSGRIGLWLNAVGAKADLVERAVRDYGLPICRTHPVPLSLLPRLLVTPHAHLITLRDSFVGFVMPSKVYACVQSGRDILYVGSARSDVHLLCSQGKAAALYQRVDVGDVPGVARSLEAIAERGLRPACQPHHGMHKLHSSSIGWAVPSNAQLSGETLPLMCEHK